MSKVAVKGSASGTGTFTIEAPNSNNNRTLTLPDEAGTVVTSNTAIPQSQIASALNATGSAPIYACRAWVNFNGTGTVAIRASGNVTSITDRGTGQYTVNFTSAMPDANYSFSGLAGTPSANSGAYLHIANTINPTTSALAVDIITDGGTRQDAVNIGISIFR